MRGFTLIEAMIAIAVLSVGGLVFASFERYQRATERAFKVEGLVRVVDLELERARACRKLDCLEALVVEGASLEAERWVRAKVRRTLEDGPNETVVVTVFASADGVRLPVMGSTLVWVRE